MSLFQETKMSHKDIETCFIEALAPKMELIKALQLRIWRNPMLSACLVSVSLLLHSNLPSCSIWVFMPLQDVVTAYIRASIRHGSYLGTNFAIDECGYSRKLEFSCSWLRTSHSRVPDIIISFVDFNSTRKVKDEDGLFHGSSRKRKVPLCPWRRRTMRPCDRVIQKTLELVRRMTEIADEGDAVREDVNCGVLYGVLRDSAYKIRQLAEKERESHVRKGWWHEQMSSGIDASDASPDSEIKEKAEDKTMVGVIQNNGEKGGK